MLTLRDLPDLKKYLEVRLEMARNQKPKTSIDRLKFPITTGMADGMVFAFEESIKAVQALIDSAK